MSDQVFDHDTKKKARAVYAKAVKRGDITRPKNCEKCGRRRLRIEGHHRDYSRPLDVQWLCESCHRRAHYGLGVVVILASAVDIAAALAVAKKMNRNLADHLGSVAGCLARRRRPCRGTFLPLGDDARRLAISTDDLSRATLRVISDLAKLESLSGALRLVVAEAGRWRTK